MKILYYYYYLFYTKILPDDQPHSTVIFCLSAMESFIVNGLLNIISITIFCYNIPKWPMLVVAGAVFINKFFEPAYSNLQPLFSPIGKTKFTFVTRKPINTTQKTLFVKNIGKFINFFAFYGRITF